MKIPALCLALLLVALPALGADRGVFFEVRGPQGSVWLLGSLHAATADFYPLNPAINAAFHDAQKLVVEVDMDRIDPQTLQQWLQVNALYPAGHSLRNALSPATATALDQACLRDRLPCEQLMQQRPGLFVMSLVSTRMAQLGYDPQLGIDQHFVQRARDTKPIVELEDWRDQLGLLLDFSDADLLVQQLLEQLDDADDFLRDTSAAWRAGDLERLNQLLIEDELTAHPELAGFYERLYHVRNRQMAQRIAEMMTRNETLFVVVGAAHLVGDTGIPQLLIERGLAVEQR